LALYHVSAVIQFAVADRFFDFAHYYLYARNLVEGRSLFDLEAPHLLAEQLGIRYADAPPNYPPPFYLAMGLLALLPYHLSSIVWLLLNELFLLAAILGRGAEGLHRHPARMAMLSLVVFAFQPLYETLALGQANLLLLAGVTLAVRLWAAGSLWSGVVLGTMVLVKPQFALFSLLWIHPAQWRYLGTAVGTVCVLVLGSWSAVGQDAWLRYWEYVGDLPCDISLWALNISLRGFLFRLNGSCLADGFGDPMAVTAALVGGVILGALALYLWKNPPAGPTDRFRAAGLILCAIFLTSPYTQEHHLTVLLMTFAGLALDVERPSKGIHRWGWVLAFVLLATAYSLARFPSLHLGLPSVLLFGKGFGVILLGALLVASSNRRRKVAPSVLPLLLVAVGMARAAHAALKGIFLGPPDFAGLLEIYLATALLLFWAVFFRARVAKAMT
jgi:hypothetical protein